MDTLLEEKRRLKRKRKTYCNENTFSEKQKYVNLLITRILISVILFFGLIITMNISDLGRSFIKDNVLSESFSFTKVKNLYNEYFGNILPFEDLMKDESTVFNEKMIYEEINNYKDGYELTVKNNYLVPIINSGIVVFIGEKEGLGNTLIIQGVDEIDYWYSNVTNTTANLYDYVSKGTYLGTTNGTKLYLTFKKGNDYLDFDEVVK